MAILTVDNRHQTSKPPMVTRDKRTSGHDLITITWGTLTIRVEAEEARELAQRLATVLF